MDHQCYITTLKKVLDNVEVVEKPDRIQIYDGVDIIYSLVSESDAYFIFISERGIISEYCKILDQQLAQLYFAIFVKNAFVDVDFSLVPKIEALGHDSNTLQALFQQEGLSPFFAIDSKEPQKINLDTTSNRLYYVDSNHREYDITYLPNRINQFFYWAVVKLRNIRKWLSDLDDYSATKQKYESPLLGFCSYVIIKNGLKTLRSMTFILLLVL